MDVIYCAGGGKRLALIAIEEGFLYGARSDDIRKMRCDGMIDVNWKNYDWQDHIAKVILHRPKYAVVPDILNTDTISIALEQGRQIDKMAVRPIIVPKVDGVVRRFPADWLIGISVPTSYSGFIPKLQELNGRVVHLLGGSPAQQRELWWYFTEMGIRVNSVDGNSHSRASDFGSYWNGYKWCDEERSSIGKYDAFRKSCKGIMRMWKLLKAI